MKAKMFDQRVVIFVRWNKFIKEFNFFIQTQNFKNEEI